MAERDFSLYDLLSVTPPDALPSGETATTRQKETIDADAEALDFE